MINPSWKIIIWASIKLMRLCATFFAYLLWYCILSIINVRSPSCPLYRWLGLLNYSHWRRPRWEEGTYTHSSSFAPMQEPKRFRSLSVFTLQTIGPAQWAPSISRQRGYAKILKNEASGCRGRRRTAAIPSFGDTVALLPANRRLGNKERPISTSFRISTSARP